MVLTQIYSIFLKIENVEDATGARLKLQRNVIKSTVVWILSIPVHVNVTIFRGIGKLTKKLDFEKIHFRLFLRVFIALNNQVCFNSQCYV